MTLVEVLQGAKERVTKGWLRHRLQNEEGTAFCLVGALWFGGAHFTEALGLVDRVLKEQVSDYGPQRGITHRLASWNNQVATQEDVIYAFELARKEAEKLSSSDK